MTALHRDRSRSFASVPRAASAAALTAMLLLAGPSWALPPLPAVSPFDMTGFLQAATLDGTGSLAGGTLTVNGQVVTVPANLLVQLPATFLTWPELFRLAPAPYGPTQTGLALGDVPAPLGAYEVHVQGNRVGDQYLAGLVSIFQVQLAAGQGFVNYVDYDRGELRVGGVLGVATSGQRVRLNDPIGRFGRAWTPDVRFTVDEDNPTVRSTTGYPMCVARTAPALGPDSECPDTNRPRDPTTSGFLSVFTMPAPGITAAPDPTKQAPFEIGDFVTYAGILVKDGPDPTAGPAAGVPATLVAAYSVIANLGIFTFPGTDPAYVAIDVAILGVGGTPIAGIPQEATVRTVFEGFSTDPTRVVSLWGLDQDPCTGAVSTRDWGLVAVDPGPPVGAVLGRWRFRPPSKVLAMPSAGVFLPATRSVRAQVSGQHTTVANGLTGGRYDSPIGEYLFPENLAVGGRPVPLNFQEFPFLAQGSGPWPGAGPSPSPAGVVGQLSPWPGAPAPAAPACSPPAAQPVADAGPAQSVASGSVVALDGSASADPGGLPLTYAWSQVGGTPVALSDPAAPRPTFTAPAVASGQPAVVLTFQLVVSSAGGSSGPVQVTVTVQPQAAAVLPPLASAGPAQAVASGVAVQLDGRGSSDPNVPPLPLRFSWTQIAGPTVALAGPTSATPIFTAPAVPSGAPPAMLGFWLVVTNSAGLGATSQVDVTVSSATDVVTILTAVYRRGAQRLQVTARSSSAGARLTLKGVNGGPDVALTPVAGVPTATLTGVPNPGTVRVVSSQGGSATASTTVRP